MNFDNPIIAAVRSGQEFSLALQSPVSCIFMLRSDILTIGGEISRAHEAGKELFFHLDFMEGVARDGSGMEYLKRLGADGIVTTRANLIRIAKECGLKNVQRFFIVDSHSVETAVKTVSGCNPDMVELMPGIICEVIPKFRAQVSVPVIAGGLIESKQQVIAALNAGAGAVSTGKKELWYK